MAIPTFYVHQLGTATSPSGDVTVVLRSEISTLTIPDGIAASIVMNGFISKRMDVREGGSQLEHVPAVLIEDYSTYSEGFWYKVIHGGVAELQFFLDEGNGDTHIFWGRIIPEESSFEEVSIIDGVAILTIQVMIGDAFAARLQEVTAAELFTYYNATNPLYTEISGVRYLTYLNIMSSLLFLTKSQSVDNADITLESEAIQYYANGDWRSWDDLSIWYTVGGGGGLASGTPVYWSNNGWTGLEIFRSLCKSHSLYPEIDLDVANNDHKIHLCALGSPQSHAIPAFTEVRPPSKSTRYSPRHPSTVQNIAVQEGDGDYSFYIGDQSAVATTLPPNTNWDVILITDFITWTLGAPFSSLAMFYITGGVAYEVTDTRHYQGGGVWSGGDTLLATSVAGHTYRHWGAEQATLLGYEREYPGLKVLNNGTDSRHTHTKFRPGCWITISDGVTSKNYIAIEIGKDITENRTKIIWREWAV